MVAGRVSKVISRGSWLGAGLSLLALGAPLGCAADDGAGEGGDEAGTAATAGTEDSSTGSETTTADTADTGETGAGAPRPNWHEDVAPVVAQSCESCHRDGGIAPFTMADYASTSPWAGLMADVAQARTMPPWHAVATEACTPPADFKHDPRLSDETIQLLRDWADLGAPEGDPADAAPLPEPPSLELADPDVTVLLESPVEVEAEGVTLDFFNCVSLDPGHTEDVFINGLQVIPGNSEILHHVLVYIDESGASASWPGGVLEDCGGGAGVGGAQLVAGWVPGSLPMEPPEGVGITLPEGARLILNVHHHATGAGPEVDAGTGLALRFSPETPAYESFFRLLGAPGDGDSLTGPLQIPAGATDHVEEFVWEVSANGQPFPDSVDARIWAVANHMHLVGVDIRAWVESAEDGTETCLLNTPEWDFDWQRVYEYDVPVEQSVRVRAGDLIHVRCVYDNSLDNTAMAQGLAELGLSEPVDVGQGEGTLDEMCLTGIGVGVKLP